ncbi:MAG: glycosyltransferase family 9 protein, partial [Geobacteraceae bacterium]
LLKQTYRDFTLKIVNNGSTDTTGNIAEIFAQNDSRVTVIHNEKNDPLYCYKMIEEADTLYYMWAAGHDYYAPAFIEKCIAMLEADPRIVLSYPRASWFQDETVCGEIPGAFDTRGMDSFSRAMVVSYGLVESFQQYGIYRREVLQSLTRHRVVGFDHVMLTELAFHGAFALVDEPLFFMRKAENWGNWEVYRQKHLPDENDGVKAFLKMIDAYMSIADRANDPIDKELFKMAFYTASLLRYRCNLIPFNESVHSLYSKPGFRKIHEAMIGLNKYIQIDLQSMNAEMSSGSQGNSDNSNHQEERNTSISSVPADPVIEDQVPLDFSHGKILWVRTDSIGDAVLAMSMLPYVKEKYPHAEITVLCQGHIAELYEPCPYVNSVVTFNKSRTYTDEEYRIGINTSLCEQNFDLVLNSVFSREPLADILSLDTAAGQKIAFNGDFANRMTESFRSKANPLYSTIIPNKGEYKLELERHRDFLQALGIEAPSLHPVVWTTPEDIQYADTFFRENCLDPNKTIALFAGAQAEARTHEGYGLALARVCRDRGYSVIALGSPNDFSVNEKNLADLPDIKTLNLCGKTSLRQSAEILRNCRLAVGAETSMAHMACAVGTPNVVLLGGGHFGRFMPYSPLTSAVSLPLECYCCNWACRYESAHCVKGISHEVLYEAIRQTLESDSDKPRIFLQAKNLWHSEGNYPSWKVTEIFHTGTTSELVPVSLFLSPDECADALLSAEEIAATAIVSTCNSEEFIQDRIEDLSLQKLKELCARFDSNPDDRDTILALVSSLKGAGINSEATRICSAYLQKNPDDREILEINRSIASNQ